MAKAEPQVEKIQVIPLSDGKWKVPSSSQPGVDYDVALQEGRLICNCPAGRNGKACKHKKAVMQVEEALELDQEKQVAEPAKKGVTKNGYAFDEVTSALQKSIRRGDERKAVYWALELYKTAPHYLIKRLMIIASEDVGMASPHTVGIVNQLALGWTEAKKFSWYVSAHQPIQMTMMLARAPKSTEVEDLIAVTELDMIEGKLRDIPADALDEHTAQGREMAKQAGKTKDDMDRDWYVGRIKAGIPLNSYTMELMDRRPEWFLKLEASE